MRTFALLCALVVAVPAQAQSSPEQVRDAARARFKKGTELYQGHDFAGAVVEYKAAYELAPLPQFLFNLGQAYRQAPELPDAKRQAIHYYRSYLAALPDGPGAEDARQHVVALEAALANEPPPPAPAPPVVIDKKPTPLVRRWYVWTPVALVVAGGVIAGVVVGTRRPWNNVANVGPGIASLEISF